jgi:uncharacterized protein
MHCKRCGRCCAYVTVSISIPSTEEDWEELRWYLCHKDVRILYDLDDSTLAVQFMTPCKEQTADGHCRIYETRPSVCADHSPDVCECNTEENYIEIACANDLSELRKRLGC